MCQMATSGVNFRERRRREFRRTTTSCAPVYRTNEKGRRLSRLRSLSLQDALFTTSTFGTDPACSVTSEEGTMAPGRQPLHYERVQQNPEYSQYTLLVGR